MVAKTDTPCSPWTPIWCKDLLPETAAISGAALEAATHILWAKSGRQYDECSVTWRPCRKDCWDGGWPFASSWNEYGTSWPHPYTYNGQWFNLGCGGCVGTCSCTALQMVALPDPVASITSVKIDGATLPASGYTVYDYRTLLRVDGGLWPICNDLNKPSTAVGTWEITATVGVAVPTLGKMAVGELAYELALACVGNRNCALPSAVQSIVRQGVSMTFLDPNEMFADGKLGLRLCDLFIGTVNPQGLQMRAQAIDVEGRGPRMRT